MRALSLLAPLSLVTLAACAGGTIELDADAIDGELTEASVEEQARAFLAQTDKVLAGADFDVTRVKVDHLGIGHVRIQQKVGDVPVLQGEAVVNVEPNGLLSWWSHELKGEVEVDTTPAFDATRAIELALEHHRPGALLQDAPQVFLAVKVTDTATHLVWHVRLMDLEHPDAPSAPIVLVDAHTGEIVESWEDLKSTSLTDADKTTWDAKRRTRLSRASVGDSSDGDLNTTHDAVGSTLDYLSTALGRSSFDGAGGHVDSYGHYGRNVVNAYWDGSSLLFGDGDGSVSNYLGVLDIAAHEFGHGVTDYEANLTYSYESGALNEAASDMLAAAVEAYVDGGVSNSAWDLGEDCWLADAALRYMDEPSLDGSSRDHYSNRYTGSSDNGGVHWNSGIANHWFYLLSEGGQHHDSAYRSGTSIVGIGIDDAYAIWYYALANSMTSGTDFAGARTETEAACAALGYSTAACDAVSQAWYEVGVGSDPGGSGGTDTGTTDTGTTDTGTTDTGTTGGGCAAGYTEVVGTLTGTGDDDQYTYTSSSSGVHNITLAGAAGTDFDLYLYQYKGRGYKTKDSSTSTGSSEAIAYDGSPGDYLIQVTSYSGSGDYTLCHELPS